MSDHPQLPPELQSEVMTLVEQTQQPSRWSVRRTLKALEIPSASYYRWRRVEAWERLRPRSPTGSMYQLLNWERQTIIDYDLEDYTQAKSVIARIIAEYNHVRLHSALMFLRPVDYYRGNPEALLAERRRKLSTARELRKQENIRLRQRLLPWPEEETVSYPARRSVSL